MRTLEDPGTGLWQGQGEPQDRSIHAIPDTPSHSAEQLSSFQGALKLREQLNKCLKTVIARKTLNRWDLFPSEHLLLLSKEKNIKVLVRLMCLWCFVLLVF